MTGAIKTPKPKSKPVYICSDCKSERIRLFFGIDRNTRSGFMITECLKCKSKIKSSNPLN